MKTKRIPNTWKLTGGLVALVCLAVWVPDGRSAEAEQPRNIAPASATESYWAIVVGVDSGQSKSAAAYRTGDAEGLAAVLEGCGYQRRHILRMTQRAASPGDQPLRTNVETQTARFLHRIGTEDRLLFFFAGNAYRDQSGRIYLAPADWDRANPAATGLAVTWLRKQLEGCPAQVKLSVLDLGGRESDTGGKLVGVTGQEVGEALEDVKGLTILTNCRSGEKSLVWESTGQSVFGFWFNQAVAGHADRDCNNEVSVVELCDYVFANVSKTARELFGQQQRPARLGDPRMEDTLGVSRVRPVTLRGALDKMADQLAAAAVRNRVSRMGVAEFRSLGSDSQTVRLLGGRFGLLGRWCADELERCLADKAETAATRFELIPHNAFHATLARGGFSPASFLTSATRGITVHGKEVETVVLGSFCARTGRVLTLRCDLRDTAAQRLLGRAQATALLDESQWAMLGHSAAIKPEDLPTPMAPSSEHPMPPGEQEGKAISKLEENSKTPSHGTPALRCRVAILVNGVPRQTVPVQNDEYVPLAQGEVYKIGVENHYDRPVYLRLLIDGLNTLPEPAPTGSAKERADQGPVYLPAQRVSLDKARAWRVKPRPSNAEARRYAVSGFYRKTGKSNKGEAKYSWETFKVVDAPDSLAYRQGYTEQIGLITAAFYEVPADEKPLSRSRGLGDVGTGPGEERQGELHEYQETPVGRFLGVINIHYVEPEVLERLQHSPNKAAGEPGKESQPPVDPGPKEEESKTSETTPQGPAATLVTRYLAAAATLSPSATKPFLSTTCQTDMVTEFSANAKSGWNFSAKATRITKQTVNAQEQKATVVADVVFQGGNTFMSKTQTFSLVREDGDWKISAMVPAPSTAPPGFVPLTR